MSIKNLNKNMYKPYKSLPGFGHLQSDNAAFEIDNMQYCTLFCMEFLYLLQPFSD
jgi:hypothetical protein